MIDKCLGIQMGMRETNMCGLDSSMPTCEIENQRFYYGTNSTQSHWKLTGQI